MKKTGFFIAFFLLSGQILWSQSLKYIDIPNIGEYVTLKCDFHIHTVFSDGNVWPTVRTKEARMEGLDAIAITEHVEFRRLHDQGYINGDHNTAYEIAKSAGNKNFFVIHGSEITRRMPPGHWNAIFIEDGNKLDTKEYMDAFKEAKAQNAFIFWNHPGWWSQAPNETVWLPEHTKLYEEGYMHGIEVVNSSWYFPEAHAWALEKNLTMLGNSDTHSPMAYNEYYIASGHRPMTLVFAKEKSAQGIRNALDDRRTVIYHEDKIIGAEKWVRPLFDSCLRVTRIARSKTRREMTVYVKNVSCLTFKLVKKGQNEQLNYLRDKNVNPYEEFSMRVRYPEGMTGKWELNFVVTNWLVGPNEGLKWVIPLEK